MRVSLNGNNTDIHFHVNFVCASWNVKAYMMHMHSVYVNNKFHCGKSLYLAFNLKTMYRCWEIHIFPLFNKNNVKKIIQNKLFLHQIRWGKTNERCHFFCNPKRIAQHSPTSFVTSYVYMYMSHRWYINKKEELISLTFCPHALCNV